MTDNRQLVFELPTIAGTIPPGARIQADFDCPDCGAHYTREVEPVPQIVSVDCPCGIKVELHLRRPATPHNLAPRTISRGLDECRRACRKFGERHHGRVMRAQAPQPPVERGHIRVGRNDPCPCGSGKKSKHCCRGKR